MINLAVLDVNEGKPERAVFLAQKALYIQPESRQARDVVAMGKLQTRDWSGWDDYIYSEGPPFRVLRQYKSPQEDEWMGEPDKTVVIYREQGLGDEIMFASMLPDVLKTNKVILESHPRLETLFKKAFPDIKVYGTRDQREVKWADDFDYQISIGSLGRLYRRKKEDFPGTPYLVADPLPKGQKFRVGISWTGGLKAGRIRTREIPLAWWKSILDNDCEFVSLQYTDCSDAIAAVNRLGYDIREMDEYVKAHDYYDTARLVQSCDLVISCCTSVIHLAGALGVPCWVMTPNKPAWRYGIKGPMPWYRSVRLYRQPAGNSDMWRNVVAKVGYDLSELIKERKAA